MAAAAATVFGYPSPPIPSTAPIANPATATEWTVVKVYDGDTITVKSDLGVKKRVRFSCIDAPELKQAGGIESRNALINILAAGGNKVLLQEVGIDPYGRSLALVSMPKLLAQTAMLNQGMAYYYWAYSKSCPQSALLQNAEQGARLNKIGVWAEVTNIYPWIWRKQHRIGL